MSRKMVVCPSCDGVGLSALTRSFCWDCEGCGLALAPVPWDARQTKYLHERLNSPSTEPAPEHLAASDMAWEGCPHDPEAE